MKRLTWNGLPLFFLDDSCGSRVPDDRTGRVGEPDGGGLDPVDDSAGIELDRVGEVLLDGDGDGVGGEPSPTITN